MQGNQENRKLSAEEIRGARKGKDVSIDGLAGSLGMWPNGDRKIRSWGSCDEEISGPASVTMEALASGWQP